MRRFVLIPAGAQLLLSSRDPSLRVNDYNERGESPLTVACHRGNTSIVLLLLQRGADVNQPSLKNAGMHPSTHTDPHVLTLH